MGVRLGVGVVVEASGLQEVYFSCMKKCFWLAWPVSLLA